MTSYNYNHILLLSLSISHINRRRVAQCNGKALAFCRADSDYSNEGGGGACLSISMFCFSLNNGGGRRAKFCILGTLLF